MALITALRMALRAPGGYVECEVDIDDGTFAVRQIRTHNPTGAPVNVTVTYDADTMEAAIPVGDTTMNVPNNKYFIAPDDPVPWRVAVGG